MAVGKQKTLFVDHTAIKQPKRVAWKVGANSIQILVTVINHWVRDAREGTTSSLVLMANTGVFLCRLHASEHCQDSYQTMRLHRLESVIRLWTHKGVQGDTLTVTLQGVWEFHTSVIPNLFDPCGNTVWRYSYCPLWSHMETEAWTFL